MRVGAPILLVHRLCRWLLALALVLHDVYLLDSASGHNENSEMGENLKRQK